MKTKGILKKTAVIEIAVCVIFMSLILLGIFGKLDSLILLEDKYPLYWKYLSDGKSILREIDEEELVADYGYISTHNAIDEDKLVNTEILGVKIESTNGEVLISGVAEENIWPRLVSDDLELEEGLYYYSIGNGKKDLYVYLEEMKGISSRIVCDTEETFFCVESSNAAKYQIKTSISRSDRVDSIMLRPVITRISDNIDLDDAIRTVRIWNVPSIVRGEISDIEYEIFDRQQKYTGGDFKWNSLVFSDSTGIQYIDGEKRMGMVDSFGRIAE